MLAFHPQRLATGCEIVNSGSFLEDPLRERRRGLDDVLAIVQHKQDTERTQTLHQRWQHVFCLNSEAQRRRDGEGHQSRVRHSAEIHEAYSAAELLEHPMSDGHGDGRFSDTARTDDRHKALCNQIRSDGAYRRIATDHSRQRRRQDQTLAGSAARILRQLRRAERGGFAPDRRNKALALANYIGDVSFLAIAMAVVIAAIMALAEHLRRPLI
jgi:hypothetical protein